MLRALAVIAAAGGCLLAGMNSAARLARRYAVLSELCAAMREIRLGLQQTNRTVAALMAACGERETKPMFTGLAAAVAAGRTPLAAWEGIQRADDAALRALAPGDRRTLTLFFSLFGGSDRYSQMRHVDETYKILMAQCADAKRVSEKNGRVYRTLGALLGVGVAILLL